MNSIISDAWKRAEELKKEKERQKKLNTMRVISPRGTQPHAINGGVDKENSCNYNGEEYICNDPELKSIIDAAWVSQRDKVFKKKRHSVNGKKEEGGTLASARSLHHHELEEIDELEETIKIEDAD